jgi:hypothetical protein
MMDLRIHRTFAWVSAPFTNQTPIGGPVDMHLESTDVLEMWFYGQWVPVPVFEEPAPEHPRVQREREEMERMVQQTKIYFENRTPEQLEEEKKFLDRLGIKAHKPDLRSQ